MENPTETTDGKQSEKDNVQKEKFNINKMFATLLVFLTDTVDKLTEVKDLSEIAPDSTVVFKPAGKVKEVIVAIADSVSDDGKVLRYRLEMMSKKVLEWEPKKVEGEIFVIDEIYPGNFKGDHKKDLQSIVKEINATVNPSVRIGGIFFPSKEIAESKEGQDLLKWVEKWILDKFNIKTQFRWSSNSGKVQKVDSVGYNVLALNELKEKLTALFQANMYYHNHNEMFQFHYVAEKITPKVVKADEEFTKMMDDYGKVAPKVVKTEESAPEATAETKTKKTEAVEA